MKFTKLISLMMAAVMLVLTMASCGAGGQISASVTILGKDGETLVEKTTVKLDNGMKYDEALVIAVEGLSDCEYDYPAGGEFNSITIFGETYAQDAKDDTGAVYYWGIETINGKTEAEAVAEAAAAETAEGEAAPAILGYALSEAVADGDDIVFRYMATDSTKATISIYDENGKAILEAASVEVKEYGKNLSIPQVIKNACDEANIECAISNDGKSVKNITSDCVTLDNDTQKAYFVFQDAKTNKEVTKIKAGDSIKIVYKVEVKEVPAA